MSTDARAGQHREHGLGNHREVDRDAVALLHAQPLQHVRRAAGLAIQIPVRVRAAVAGFPFPDQRGLVAPRAANVPVGAVDARIELAAGEPACVRRRPVEHTVPGAQPLQLRGLRRPEAFGIGVGRLVQPCILHARAGAEGRWRRKRSIFLKQRRDIVHAGNLRAPRVAGNCSSGYT
jgi:hypothetical protein